MNDNPLKAGYLAGLAGITGVFLGAALGVIASLAGWPKPWAWAGAGFVLFSALAWLLLMGRSLRVIEQALGVDIDRDGFIGQPLIVSGAPLVDRVELQQADGLAGERLTLPVNREQMIAASVAMVEGANFGHNLSGPGQPFSRSDFESLRDLLIRRGYAKWVSTHARNRGVYLTGKGQALVKGYASLAKAPRVPEFGRTYANQARSAEFDR